jgi:hypothetical protein
VSGQTIEELREVAEALSGALQLASRENDLLKQENATLKRQVEVFVEAWSKRIYCQTCLVVRTPLASSPEVKYCQNRDSCKKVMRAWSLEQAKKGQT